jgi:acetyl esterase/lipase
MLSPRALVTRFVVRNLIRPFIFRGSFEDWRRRLPPPPTPKKLRVEPTSAGGVPAEWVLPQNASSKVLYYLHGGGFVMLTPETYRPLAYNLARRAGVRALVPDYRLAPEHPYPAAVEDCLAGYRWLLESGVPAHDIVVAGDSAGGALTLTTLLAARDAGLPMPAGAVCISPVTDLTLSGASHKTRKGDEVILTPGFVRQVTQLYLDGRDAKDPLASPLFADLRGLPPLLVHVGTHELLLDDSLRLVERARAAGVDVTLREYEGLWHVFHSFLYIPEARAAVDDIATFMRSSLGRQRAAA